MLIKNPVDLSKSITHRNRIKLSRLNQRRVTVGIHRKDNTNYPGRDVTVAKVGFYHEYGTSSLPARIWLRIFSLISEERKKFLDKLSQTLIKQDDANYILKEIGQYQKDRIKERILSNQVTPPSKKASGITLVDEGYLVDSVDYEVH